MGNITPQPLIPPSPVTLTAPTFPDQVIPDPLGAMFMTSVYWTIHQKYVGKEIGVGKVGKWRKFEITPDYMVIERDRWVGGRTWKELKKSLTREFMSVIRDAGLIQFIKNRILPLVPVRSGRLLDTIMKSMFIQRRSWYNTHFWAILSFIWTLFRPYPIPGRVQHSPPETGYGEYYVPTNTIPNRHLIRRIGTRNALYLLNDPTARSDPIHDIKRITKDVINNDFAQIFSNLTMVLHTKKITLDR